MDELKAAIKHFESLQKRYTMQHNGKQCEYVKVALNAMYKELLRYTKPHEFDKYFE